MVCPVRPHLTVDRLLEYLPRLKPWQENAVRQILLALTMGAAVLSVAAPARAEDHRIYGVELEGFEYPYDVSRYAFRSQGSDLSMAYMDVKPQTTNGRTAVLLHGRNFCASLRPTRSDSANRPNRSAISSAFSNWRPIRTLC